MHLTPFYPVMKHFKQLNIYGTFWSNELDSTPHHHNHHRQNTKWGNIFWKNAVQPSSRAQILECRIKAEEHWSCSGEHFILVLASICPTFGSWGTRCNVWFGQTLNILYQNFFGLLQTVILQLFFFFFFECVYWHKIQQQIIAYIPFQSECSYF